LVRRTPRRRSELENLARQRWLEERTAALSDVDSVAPPDGCAAHNPLEVSMRTEQSVDVDDGHVAWMTCRRLS
jgi:hypothetical protein